MKYSVAVLLFIGAISSAEAIKIETRVLQHNEQEQSIDKTNPEAVKKAQEKAAAAKQKAVETKKKIEDLKAKQHKIEKEMKPDASSKIQTAQEMDVKTNTGLVVSVEAVKKPENSNKVQELAAMEEALKKATDETRKQRMAL
jgi:outer membrane murein-binding lipoprotein Lpp